MRRYLPLLALAMLHGVVDLCATMIEPLWPDLREHFGLVSVLALSAAFVLQSIPTSFTQAVVGYVRDHRPSAWLVWLAPAVAITAMTSIGLTSNLAVVGVLLVVGGTAIGAFHPEAAVQAGRSLPENRTRAMSIFMLGGACGLASGPTIGGWIVSVWGLSGLTVLALPLLFIVVLVSWSAGLFRFADRQDMDVSADAATGVESRTTTSASASGGVHLTGQQWRLVVFLLVICSLRVVPNVGLGKVLSFVLRQRGFGTAEIGQAQSIFLASASLGMFLLAFRFPAGREKSFMVVCPLLGIPLVAALSWTACPTPILLGLLVPTGLILWGTVPAMVSYAQQLLPRSTGLASGITMGMAWGTSGLLQAPVTAYFRTIDMPQAAFLAMVPCLLAAGLGATLLPELSDQIAMSDEPETSSLPVESQRSMPATIAAEGVET